MVAPLVIDPNGVFSKKQLQEALQLRNSTLRREVREKRLRVSRLAGKYWFLGSWILEWLAGGELKR
jgi:hypothetical protein